VAGFNITDNPLNLDEASATLAQARTHADYVVVFMHWGAEYASTPNTTQTQTAHWLIDQGADAVIGAHPHWVQSVELYRGKPIAYSLGNFIFDQDWSAQTRQGLVTGLAFLPDRTELHLFPIQIDQSVPRHLTGKDRITALTHLASISDPALGTMIQHGIVTATSSSSL
jgi:poly-gamma-glutamate synthesis protein (capsule biosynthesis protein)